MRLGGRATLHSSRLDLKKIGKGSTKHSGQPYRLNATFLEWLMVFPIGWTECIVSATQLSQWLLLMRIILSENELESKVEWL